MEKINIIDRAVQFPDQAVACPICNQEFWGYSEIIYCKCGWTFVKEEMPGVKRSHLRSLRLSEGKTVTSETKSNRALRSNFGQAKSEPAKTKGLAVFPKD
jgi:hypothetical protein